MLSSSYSIGDIVKVSFPRNKTHFLATITAGDYSRNIYTYDIAVCTNSEENPQQYRNVPEYQLSLYHRKRLPVWGEASMAWNRAMRGNMKFSIGETVELFLLGAKERLFGVIVRCRPWDDSTYDNTYDVAECDRNFVPTQMFWMYVHEHQLTHWEPHDSNAAWDRAMKGI